MPFGTIASQSVNYVPRAEGRYVKEGITFTDPQDEFLLRPLSKRKDGNVSTSATRIKQEDVTTSTGVKRVTAFVTLTITIPAADNPFSPTELDSMVLDLSNFLTPDTINRRLYDEL